MVATMEMKHYNITSLSRSYAKLQSTNLLVHAPVG